VSGKIFINYRRGDEPGFTQALFARLEQAFSSEHLFMDVDNIPPGEDFVRMLDTQVEQCDALLAVIGKGWLNATDEHDNRRLDDPNDFVRIEIESALKHGKRVIPILVNDARMPRPDDLPESLRPLTRRNAVRLTHERFRADALSLIKALQRSLEEAEALRGQAERQRKEEEEAARLRSLQEAQSKQRAHKLKENDAVGAAQVSDAGHEHDAELRADALRRAAKRVHKADLEALQQTKRQLNTANIRGRASERYFPSLSRGVQRGF
jgi:TIR domain